MKDIVLIPTYLRPEYLQICLEHLAQTISTPTPKEFWICADRRPNDEHRYKILLDWQNEVLGAWRGVLPIRFIQGASHTYSGNSFNVLESYKRAYNEPGVRNVYLVEDDVFVVPDFFRWHEAIAEVEPNACCSIAYRCSRNGEAHRGILQPGSYFTTARDYASIGVRWGREHLSPILDHARADYYADQTGYIQRRFAGNRFAGDFSEQDGLIMRVMWEQHWFTAWPYVPRCFHMGWYGYHRPNGKRPDGFLESKIGAIKATISNAEKLKLAAPDFGDIEPYPTEPMAEYSGLTKLQHFD
jgi:hypothetical protein